MVKCDKSKHNYKDVRALKEHINRKHSNTTISAAMRRLGVSQCGECNTCCKGTHGLDTHIKMKKCYDGNSDSQDSEDPPPPYKDE